MFEKRRLPPPIPRRRIDKDKGFTLRTFYQILISIVIFIFAIFLNQTEDPLGERMVAGVQYFLSTESDFQPVLQKVVGLGLQMENMEWPFITNIGSSRVMPTLGGIEEKPLKIPVSGKIIRHFGWPEEEKDYQDYHEGLDIKAEVGSQVKAAEAGIVEKVGQDQILGNYIIVSHESDLKTLYGQLDQVKVQEKQEVNRGEIIGTVGESGVVEAPHLHFEVREKEELINPLTKFSVSNGNKGI